MYQRFMLSFLLLGTLLLTVGCGSEPDESAQRSQEIAVDLEPEEKAAPTKAPTSTALPTYTPQPTQTSQPTNAEEPTATKTARPTRTPKPTATKAQPTEPPPTEPPPTEPPPTQPPPTAVPPTAIPPTQAPPTPAPPTEPPPPPPPAETAVQILIVGVNKDAEYVDLQNAGAAAVDLGNWLLVSEKGNQGCFLAGVIPPGQVLRIWALASDAGQGGFNCNFGKNIWNNSDHDPAVLYDPSGAEVSRR